jgi:hypothetical protein
MANRFRQVVGGLKRSRKNLIKIVNSFAEFEAAIKKCLAAIKSKRIVCLTLLVKETWPQKVA